MNAREHFIRRLAEEVSPSLAHWAQEAADAGSSLEFIKARIAGAMRVIESENEDPLTAENAELRRQIAQAGIPCSI